MRTHAGSVIASEAKQSIPLVFLDCFVASLLAVVAITMSDHVLDLVYG
jgi:hypothetical protein